MRVHRLRLLSALLLALVLTLGCAQNQFNRALQYELAGKNVSALQLYQQLLAHTSKSSSMRSELLTRIGECLYHMDRMQEAFTSFQKAVELDPNNTAARLRMGEMLLGSGAPDRAREQANIILRTTPTNVEALALLGAAWSDSGNLDLAKQAYQRVLENDPKRVKVAIALADIFNHQGKEVEAKQILTQTAASNPHDTAPMLALARLYEQDGDSHAAESAYRKAIAIDDSPETNIRLAQFLQRSARIAEAEQTLRKVDSQQPKYPIALADFQLLSGRPGDALLQYQRALTASRTMAPQVRRRWSFFGSRPQSAPNAADDLTISARMVEAELVAASGLPPDSRKKALAAVRTRLLENSARFDAATLDILQSEVGLAEDNLVMAKLFAANAVELAPNSAPAHYIAGLVASSSGDQETATTEWQNALDQDPHFSPPRLALAEDALAHNDPEDADEQSRLVVRDNPGDLQGILIFSRALLMEGKPLAAAIMAQRASALDPVSAEPSLILGEVALKVNNQAQALLQFERALSLQPDSDEAVNGLLRVYEAGRLSAEALQKMERVALEPPSSSTLLEVTGRLYADRGRNADAIRVLKRVIQIDPRRVTAARTLARLQAGTGDYIGATESAMKAGVDAQTLLTAYRQQDSGDWRAAVATYERALREGDQTGVAANNVAWLYAEHNQQLDRALSLAQTAAHESPNNPAVLDTLGFVHLQRREYSDAVKLLETAAHLSAMLSVPDDHDGDDTTAQIRRHLAEAYMRSGQTQAALKLAQNRTPFNSR